MSYEFTTMEDTQKPLLVYYLHYYDAEHTQKAWNEFQNHVTCVMASSYEEAIAKTKVIVNNPNIKIMGIANGKLELVNESEPLG